MSPRHSEIRRSPSGWPLRDHLKEAGLVASKLDGNRIRYRLASPAVYQFWVALRTLTAERAPGIDPLVEAYVGARDDMEPVGKEELRRRIRSGEPLVVMM